MCWWQVKMHLLKCKDNYDVIDLFSFNLLTKEKEAELKGHEDAVLDLAFDNGREGYLVSASSDCSFRVWQ